jgi:hypothetical protein
VSVCWFKQFAPTPCEWRADGLPDRAHLIPKTRLRSAGLTEKQVWDRRSYELSCRKHHHAFDNGFLELSYHDYPWSLRSFARDYGFFYVQGRGWLRETPQEAA